MTGWYTKDGSDAIFTKEDLKEYDISIKQLTEEYQKLNPIVLSMVGKHKLGRSLFIDKKDFSFNETPTHYDII